MSKSVKRGSLTLLFVILAVLGAFAVASSTAALRPAPREIVLVAEGMAFYLQDAAGQAGREANPTIVLQRGETVRVVLVNRDGGMDHDFVSDGLDVATNVVPGDGSVASILLEAPAEPGRYEYVCSLHERMMRGVVEVR
jgi:plastocyanin